MSTGLECLLLERKSGEWYYILEKWNSPKGAWNWLDYADAYGPFPSEQKAKSHLSNNHPNPGGWSVIRANHYAALSEDQKESYEDLVKYPSKRSANVIF